MPNLVFKICCLLFLCSSFSLAETQFSLSGLPAESVHWSADGKSLELYEYRADSPVQVVFSSSFKGKKCRVEKASCGAGFQMQLPAPDSKNKKHVLVSYEDISGPQKFVIHLLPRDFKGYNFNGKSQLSLPLIFSMISLVDKSSRCNLMILNGEGKIQFFRRVQEHCTDFRPHKIDGRTFYSYSLPSGPYAAGPRVLLDENFNVVQYIKGKFDPHEFLLFSLNHFLAIEIDVDRFPSGDRYANSRVREYKDGKIIFDWGVSDFLSQFENRLTATAYPYSDNGNVVSPLHFNSLQKVDEAKILVSFGGNGIGLLDKRTKKLDWVFGGNQDQFGLVGEQNSAFLHTPIYFPRENRILIFSNFALTARREGMTNILEYFIDPNEHRLKKMRVLKSTGEMSFQSGSVQEHGDGVLSIGMGFRVLGKNDFMEVDKDGKETVSIQFFGDFINAYRFYRSAP